MGVARKGRQIVAREETAAARLDQFKETLNATRAQLLDHDPLEGNVEVIIRASLCRKAEERGSSLAEACDAMNLRSPADLLTLLRAVSISGALALIEGGMQSMAEATSQAAAADLLLVDEALGLA